MNVEEKLKELHTLEMALLKAKKDLEKKLVQIEVVRNFLENK